MRFQYDSGKAASNLEKHGVPFADAEGALQDPLALTVEDEDARDEQRFVTLGLGSAGVLLVVVYTLRGEEIRLISVRRASAKERRRYES